MTKKNLVTVITDNRLVADTIATAVGATQKHDNFGSVTNCMGISE